MWSPGTERAGRVVQIFHPWDKKMVQACVESRETVISGILNSQTSALVGFKPAQPDTSQYYNVRQEILEDTEIVIPEGTTSIHAVLGSAGDDGQAGANGEAGTDGGNARLNSRETGTSVGTQGKGGAGGKGGLGGSGGKVLSADLRSPPADVLHIHIGLNSWAERNHHYFEREARQQRTGGRYGCWIHRSYYGGRILCSWRFRSMAQRRQCTDDHR